jgi:1,4-alpha-glucan branching enzyme
MSQTRIQTIATEKPAKPTSTRLTAAPPKVALQPRGLQPKAQPARTRVPRRAVRFVLEVSGARNVSVVGTFNQWNPGATPLRCAGGLKWFTYVSLALGRHEYCFVVDGKWVADPKAKAYVRNLQGGRNAVLEVSNRHSES